MSSVDSRIVTMKFDNSSFERGAATTLSTLGKLKAAMNFDSLKSGITTFGTSVTGLLGKFTSIHNPFAPAQEGLAGLQSASNSFSTGVITGGVTSISKSFIAMSTIAITALTRITTKVFETAESIASALTIDPVKSGFDEYELKLGSIQAILANTDGEGLDDVNRALNQLNKYSDKTIYNFGEMVSNIKTFTVAGIDLKTSVSSVKGLANVAALTGTNASEAARATYQMAQAMSAGSVRLQDWMSLEHAGGMAGKIFQDSLIRTAKVHGVNVDDMIEKNGSFRLSLQEGWLSTDILTETLGQFSDIYSKAQLKQMGYSEQQIADIKKLQAQAQASAQDVKTFTALFSTIKETVGSGWAQTWETVFGNLNESTKLWTNVNNVLGGMISASSNARNRILNDWKAMGGRTIVIEAIGDAFNALIDVLAPIRDAFRDIFPPKTGEDLVNMSNSFADLVDKMKPSKATINDIRRIFTGFFSAIDIGIAIFKGVAGVFGDVFDAIGAGQGGFLGFLANIADFITALDVAVQEGGLLEGFFSGLSAVLQVPARLISNLAGFIGALFTGFDAGAAGAAKDALEGIGNRLDPVAAAVERVRDAFDGFGALIADGVGKAVEAFADFGRSIAESFTADSFGVALDAINTGLFAGVVALLKNFLQGGLNVDVGGGLFSSIKDAIGGLTDTLSAMQENLQADTLLRIAAAVAILAGALLLLSTIEPKKLASALAGMAAALIIITVAMTRMTEAISILGTLKLPAIALGILAIATAVLILAGAVKLMASMELGDMLRGLVGIAAILFIISKAVVPLSANSAGIVRVGAALILVAVALKIMASALQDFAAMDLVDMGKGLLGVAGSLGVLAAGMKLMPSNIFVTAAALVVLGAALKVMATAVMDFANISWNDMVHGLGGIGLALGVIAVAMRLMPTNMVLQAVALTILSGALLVLGKAIENMGQMSAEEIAKGLITLAGSLGILAAGLALMSGSLVGAAALVVATAALAVLVPVLIALGAMSWEMIIRGLTMLAGTFLVVGLAGLLLAPLVPVIFAFSASLLLLGAGLALAGAGALAFATAFAIVAAAGAAGIAVMASIIGTIINSIPPLLAAFGQGIVAFAQAIAKGAPQFLHAFGAIITSFLTAVTKAIPKIGKLFTTLIQTALQVIRKNAPGVINAGIQLVIDLIRSMSNHVGEIVKVATDLIVNFLGALGDNVHKVVDAGFKLIIKFLHGLADAIRDNAEELGRAGADIAGAIVTGLLDAIAGAADEIKDALLGIAEDAWNAAKDFFGIGGPSKLFCEMGKDVVSGLAGGIAGYSHVANKASEDVAKNAYSAMQKSLANVGSHVDGSMDIRPVVAPVLDLSHIRKNAGGLATLLEQDKIQADVSYQNASAVAAELQAMAQAASSPDAEAAASEIKFEQNNYSPKALSSVEIYRNTKSLVSLAEEAIKRNGRN
jgi:tape measure domain-containing protein